MSHMLFYCFTSCGFQPSTVSRCLCLCVEWGEPDQGRREGWAVRVHFAQHVEHLTLHLRTCCWKWSVFLTESLEKSTVFVLGCCIVSDTGWLGRPSLGVFDRVDSLLVDCVISLAPADKISPYTLLIYSSLLSLLLGLWSQTTAPGFFFMCNSS